MKRLESVRVHLYRPQSTVVPLQGPGWRHEHVGAAGASLVKLVRQPRHYRRLAPRTRADPPAQRL
eukprot:1546699-Alexandrium_andersonii.AAC.1